MIAASIQLKEIGGITTLLADVESRTGKQTAEKKVRYFIKKVLK